MLIARVTHDKVAKLHGLAAIKNHLDPVREQAVLDPVRFGHDGDGTLALRVMLFGEGPRCVHISVGLHDGEDDGPWLLDIAPVDGVNEVGEAFVLVIQSRVNEALKQKNIDMKKLKENNGLEKK